MNDPYMYFSVRRSSQSFSIHCLITIIPLFFKVDYIFKSIDQVRLHWIPSPRSKTQRDSIVKPGLNFEHCST